MSEAVPELPDLTTAIAWLATQTVPMRTTSPDLLGQLRQAQQTPVRRIICIGIDPDPACDLLADTLKTRRADVELGLSLLAKWFDAKPLLIEKPSAENEYPKLLPDLLVRRLTRKKLNFGELPTTAGIFVLDVLTAAMVLSPLPVIRERARVRAEGGETEREPIDGEFDDVSTLEPLPPLRQARLPAKGGGEELQLPVVLDDHVLRRRLKITVNASATFADILAMAEISPSTVDLRQGPLAAHAAITPATPIAQTDLWLHALPPSASPAACTRCGECVDACPVRLQPAALLEASQLGSAKMARKFHALTCIECGLCTAVCPSALPVKAGVMAAKRLVA